MEQLTTLIYENAQNAHFLIFGLLLLAGLSLPISLDLLILAAGILASTLPVDQGVKLYLWILAGASISAWEAYWMGRLMGSRQFRSKWLQRLFQPERISYLSQFYQQYGFLTLLVGRFIPFGVRNCLFLTAGASRMPFLRFVIQDGIACLISTLSLFCLAYSFGKNSAFLYECLNTYKQVMGVLIIGILLSALYWYWRRSRSLATISAND
jgi:membrane-associated protein